MKQILILSLKESETFVTRVKSMLSSYSAQISLANEEYPKSLSSRNELVLISDVIIILSSMKLQKNIKIMEMAVAGYDRYKTMVVYVVERGYRPFSILGKIEQTNDDCTASHLDNVTPAELITAVESRVKSLVRVDLGFLETTTKPPQPSGKKVILHAAEDAKQIFRALENSFAKVDISFVRISASTSNQSLVRSCCVYIPILSQQFLDSSFTQNDLENYWANDVYIKPVSNGIGISKAPIWAQLAFCAKKIYKVDEIADLAEEVRKLVGVFSQSELSDIQAVDEDLSGAVSFTF